MVDKLSYADPCMENNHDLPTKAAVGSVPAGTEQTIVAEVGPDSTGNLTGGGSTLTSWSVLAHTDDVVVSINGNLVTLKAGDSIGSAAQAGNILNDSVNLTTEAGESARIIYTLLV